MKRFLYKRYLAIVVFLVIMILFFGALFYSKFFSKTNIYENPITINAHNLNANIIYDKTTHE